jgi:Holliday junction DNA helicase RuvA
MYHHVRGEVLDLSPTAVVVEAGGIGFDLRIPLSTYRQLKGKTEALLLTHFHVREDEHRLFGFATAAERDLFRLLVSVSSVGPATALACLCALTPEEVVRAILADDFRTLQRVKGVGRRLAERLALELKDRLDGLAKTLGVAAPQASLSRPTGLNPSAAATPEVADAVLALVSLGFERKKAEERVQETLKSFAGEARELDVEAIVKECLRQRVSPR